MSSPDPSQRQRRRQRQAAHLLVSFLTDHPDLPPVDWTVSQHGLHARFYLCAVDPRDDREAFTAWTTVIGLTHAQRPTYHVIDDEQITARRTIDDVLVTLTATVHPF
jgi:hypothetical protein